MANVCNRSSEFIMYLSAIYFTDVITYKDMVQILQNINKKCKLDRTLVYAISGLSMKL